MFDWSGDTGLAALFASALLSATILPVVLYAVLKASPDRAALAIAVATLGNTLGSLTTYGLGRLLPHRRVEGRAADWVRRFGAWPLVLAWLPVIGDALCGAAGWLRVPWLRSTLAIAAGKLARYVAVAYVVSAL